MKDGGTINEGDIAPALNLKDQDGSDTRLSDFRGRWVVLYFYPRDNTGGCTKEAVDFTKHAEEIADLGAEVIGVSPDGEESHRKFIAGHDLDIKLLSDTDHCTLETYGAWKLKKMYGREYHGVERSTFLIDPGGIVRKIWRKVKVEGHVDEVKTALKDLS